MSKQEDQNEAHAQVLGCAEAVGEARDCGLAADDEAVALDMLEEEGWDACVKFMSEQTQGRYPPHGGLLQRSVPRELTSVRGDRVVNGCYRANDDGKVYRETQRAVWWDSIRIGGEPPAQPWITLFGNANIGNRNATNLQVAGQLASDRAVYISGWSITTDSEALPSRLLQNTVITFSMGDKPQAIRHASELHKEARPIEVLVPVRQGVAMYIEFDPTLLRETEDLLYPFRIWVNLEGWIIL